VETREKLQTSYLSPSEGLLPKGVAVGNGLYA
jgi:hypothetical protein